MRMMRWTLALLAAAALAGCQGTVPTLHGDPAAGFGAILVRGRAMTPSGETFRARMALGLESEEYKYVLPFVPGRSTLYIVEPGSYRVTPLRGIFGFPESSLAVVVEGRVLRVPFPRNVLRLDEIRVRSGHVVPIGVLDVSVTRAPGERRPQVQVDLDTSKPTRRRLVEEQIQHMLDPRVDTEQRESAISWTAALDQALVDVQSDPDLKPAYKRR